jgi:hypothetical protein
MKIETYFLKYAFPCAFITLQRGGIDQKTYDRLEKAAVAGRALPRKLLEKVFSAAFRRMAKLAKEKKCGVWDLRLIREYYWVKHNKLIRQGEGSYRFAPPALKKLCRILPATVEKVSGKTAIVKFKTGGKRPVMTDLCGRLKKGDCVMVHYGYAIEKI